MKSDEFLELTAIIAGAHGAYLFEDKSIDTIEKINFERSAFIVYNIFNNRCFNSKDEDIPIAEVLKRIKEAFNVTREGDIDSVTLPKDLFNENKN